MERKKTQIVILLSLIAIFLFGFYMFFMQVFLPNSQTATVIGSLASQNSSLYNNDDDEPEMYTVEFSAGTGGSIEGTASQEVEEGMSSSAVTAVPDSGYIFTNWTGDIATSTENPLTVTNITEDMSVTANFLELKNLFIFVEGGGGYFGSEPDENSFITHARNRVDDLIGSLEISDFPDLEELPVFNFDPVSNVGMVKVKGPTIVEKVENYISDNTDAEINIVIAAHSQGAITLWSYRSHIEQISIPEDQDVDIEYIYFDAPYNAAFSSTFANVVNFGAPRLVYSDLKFFAKARKDKIFNDSNYIDWTEGYPRKKDYSYNREYKGPHKGWVTTSKTLTRDRAAEHVKFQTEPEVMDIILDKMKVLINN